MKTGRLGVALFAALVISVIATWFLYRHIKRLYSGGQLVKVVVAAKPLDTGTPLTADDLILIDWPSSAMIDGTFHKPEDLNGRIVMYPIAFKEPVREGLLAAPGATVGLTAKIPDGMRAVAIVTSEVNNVAGFLLPGSHVDVLVSFRQEGAKDPMTTTVLQDIQVLSTGEKLQPDVNGKPQNVKVVTLLLTPDDAEKLLLATNQGTVQFVLRNASDQDKVTTRPVNIKDLQTGAAAAPVVVARKAAAPQAPAKPATIYEVETYDGTKKNTVKF
ncbi:MAG: Flp pilus assembly protein CpaB [Candidatus Korobacteraceae bacterium]